MSNITLTIDEHTYRTARIVAAERGSSVSALVREYLQSLVAARAPDGRMQALFDTLDKAQAGSNAAERLSRDEVHQRGAK